MKTNTFIHIFFLSVIAIAMSGCVPKVTEKQAVCGANEAFSSLSRSCYSIVEERVRPVGTKNSDTLNQEVAKSITLTYKDGNNNSALSCRVTAVSPKIEAVSPQVINGDIFVKADLLFAAAQDVSTALLPYGALLSDSAFAERDIMKAALDKAKVTFTYSTLLAQLALFETAANNILTIALPTSVSDTSVKYFYDLTQKRSLDFATLKGFVDNRCDCSGGICTTSIAPRILESGAAGFSYTISDIDGEGEVKVVSLSIAANAKSTNYLKPAVESAYLSLSESAGLDPMSPSPYEFTLPSAHDYFEPQSSFTYSFIGSINGSGHGLTASGKGKVSGCMGLTGSVGGTSDKTCIYTPFDGDANDGGITPLKAEVTIDDLVFRANKEGSYANNYTIQYFDLKDNNLANDPYATRAESFGLVSKSYLDTFVRVVDNSINIFLVKGITTSADVRELVNNDLKAKALVTVIGGGGNFPDPAILTPSAKSLVNGTDAFDKISYSASNGHASSGHDASVMIKMMPTIDAPRWRSYASLATGSGKEDNGVININLTDTYDVVESSAATTCQIHSSGLDSAVDPLVEFSFLQNFVVSSCSCTAGACSANVTPKPNVSSNDTFSFYYRIGSGTPATYNSYREAKVTVTPVNDIPTMVIPVVSSIYESQYGFVEITVDHGGGSFESTQSLSMTPTSSSSSIVPNVQCQNYTPGTGDPNVNAVTHLPATSGTKEYYVDMNTKACYVSTAASTTSWALHPSLTAIPKCNYGTTGFASGFGAPGPSAGEYYLDTTNNKCYHYSASTGWELDKALTKFYVSYVPEPNKSAELVPLTIGLTLKDNGGTSNGGIDSTNPLVTKFSLKIIAVDSPPFFTPPTVTKADTNEGGMVVAGPFKVDEDEGSSFDEDGQSIKISSIVSDNPSVLPVGAITIFYDLNDNGVEDTGESRAVGSMLELADANNSADHNFYLKLKPIAGVSGNANIELTSFDGTNSSKTSFSLIVHSVAALHGGWANISAVGTKTDKNGAPAADSDVQCNYNKRNATDTLSRKACNGNNDCTGPDGPAATVIPDEEGVLYWDSGNKKCYRSLGSDIFSWVEFKTTCPVTRTTGLCSSQNCITSTAPTPTDVGQYYYNTTSKTCFISTGTTATDWIAYTPAKVSLAWNAFTISGSGADSSVGVAGWNVYRREKGRDYDFKSGYLRTNADDAMTVGEFTRSFTDKTAVAGKVYYYLVRPVDNSIRKLTISTPEIFSEVRVLAPAENYAFVHRWMMNQEVCNSMHMTTTSTKNVDPTKNYRCPYAGPGQSTTGNYYDIGKDLLVDISENGCPYTPASEDASITNCTSNGCIGIGSPLSFVPTLPADNGSVYYDRSSGACWYKDGTWKDVNTVAGATFMGSKKVSTALNPPLVNISKTKAEVVCNNRTIGSTIGNALSGVPASSKLSLPSKKEYIAYSAAPYLMEDNVIESMEQGFSLNGQSRCNSSKANGIDAAFTNSSIPSTSYIYSVTGTASSGIRSLYTGSVPWGNSYSTETCSSRYGIQDIYGNVAEWMRDGMTCNGTVGLANQYICKTVASATGTDLERYSFLNGGYSNTPTNPYSFDLISGPYTDSNNSGNASTGDAFLTKWDFNLALNGAGKFSFPMGMPMYDDMATTVLVNSPAIPYLLQINYTAGITKEQLHEDGIIVNGADINNVATNPTQTGSFAQGGSYLSGNGSGRFSSELVPDAAVRPDVGFRCYFPIESTNIPVDTGFHSYPY